MYTKIDARFWEDEKIRDLDPDARYLMLFLLTTKHRNMLGCYHLPQDYARFDSKLPPKRFTTAWKSVIKSGMVLYDDSLSIVLVKNFLKFNPIENPKQATGAKSKLNELPRTPLLAEVLQYLEFQDAQLQAQGKAYLQPLIEALRLFLKPYLLHSETESEGLDKRSPIPYPIPFDKPFPEGYGKQVEVKVKEEVKVSLFGGGDAHAGAQGAVDEFLDERGHRPDQYFGYTDQTWTQANQVAREIYSHFALTPPTKQDVTFVFNFAHECIPGSDPQDRSSWRIEFPKDKVNLLMYAFESAAAAGHPGSWNYIRGVLKKLHQRGIKTLEQADDFDFDRAERSNLP